jgi:hypothetical protein
VRGERREHIKEVLGLFQMQEFLYSMSAVVGEIQSCVRILVMYLQ